MKTFKTHLITKRSAVIKCIVFILALSPLRDLSFFCKRTAWCEANFTPAKQTYAGSFSDKIEEK